MTCTPRMALMLVFGLLFNSTSTADTGVGRYHSPAGGQASEESARTDTLPPEPTSECHRGLGAPLDDFWGQAGCLFHGTEKAADIIAPRMDDGQRVRRPGAAGESRFAVSRRSGSGAWIRTTLSLAGVVALIVLLAWGYRVGVAASARLAFTRGRRASGLIQVVSRTSLAPRQSVCLIRVGSQLVLVGATPDSLHTLSIINDPDLAARLAGQAAQAHGDSHLVEFRRCLELEAENYDRNDGGLGNRTARIIDIKERLAHAVRRLRAAADG